MPVSYTVYEKSDSIVYPVVFKCQKCGAINSPPHVFTVSAQYDNRGTLSRKTMETRQADADRTLKFNRSNVYYDVTTAIRDRNMKNAGFKCRCSKCQAAPVWSFFRNVWVEKLCHLLIYASIVLTALFALPLIDGNYTHLYKFAVPLVMLLAGLLIPYGLYTFKNNAVKNLDSSFMPILCKDKEGIDAAIESLGKQK